MTTRLDTQRPPAAGRAHARRNGRWYQRGYDNTPHPTWGDTQVVSIPGGFATGATAGTPGSWTPAGATPPPTVAALQGGVPVTVEATPSTPWTVGQYVQTGTAGAPGEACWTGTSWVGGKAPALAGDPEPDPASLPESVAAFSIPEIETWVDAHPHLAADVLVHEEARGLAARTTLLTWLRGFVEAHDGVDP